MITCDICKNELMKNERRENMKKLTMYDVRICKGLDGNYIVKTISEVLSDEDGDYVISPLGSSYPLDSIFDERNVFATPKEAKEYSDKVYFPNSHERYKIRQVKNIDLIEIITSKQLELISSFINSGKFILTFKGLHNLMRDEAECICRWLRNN